MQPTDESCISSEDDLDEKGVATKRGGASSLARSNHKKDGPLELNAIGCNSLKEGQVRSILLHFSAFDIFNRCRYT